MYYKFIHKHVLLVCCLLLSAVVFTNCTNDENTIVSIYKLQLDSPDFIVLTKGSSTPIELTIIPIHTTDKSISWNTSDEGVCKVEDGVITAVGVGNAVVTATSNSSPTESVEIRIRVNPISVEKIELDFIVPVVMNLDEVLQITAKVSPEDAPQELTWKSSNETVAIVSTDGNVTALQSGEAIISATSISDETKSASIKIIVGGLEETILDNSNFLGLPHSSQFQFSTWGTSELSSLWNNNSHTLDVYDIFYITNKKVTYFGVDLGVKAKLTSMRYWGRRDNYFMLRHPKTIMIYGTNDPTIANNGDSPDEDWILLTEIPFESVRPSGGTDKPIEGDIDYVYAYEGERFSFASNIPAVRYIRFKCLQTWGDVEGFWGTEIAFWGQEID